MLIVADLKVWETIIRYLYVDWSTMIKTVLTISDSVEGTTFDLKRSTSTIKDYGLDPLLVVPRIIFEDNSAEDNDVSEILDYAFEKCEFSSLSVGFLTEPEVISYIADKLLIQKKAPLVCCPSLISDEGEVLVSGEVYEVLSERLLSFCDYLIVNSFEAEALCGFECAVPNDYLRATRKIYTLYGCIVLIKGGERTNNKDVLFDGLKPSWIEDNKTNTDFENKYSLNTALACEACNDNPKELAVRLALDFISGKTSSPKDEAVTSVTSSLVTPGKSLRELARELDALKTPDVNQEPQETAVTSAIKPKGDVVSIAPPRFKFDSEVKNTITELQSLKDRLNNINNIANSGK